MGKQSNVKGNPPVAAIGTSLEVGPTIFFKDCNKKQLKEEQGNFQVMLEGPKSIMQSVVKGNEELDKVLAKLKGKACNQNTTTTTSKDGQNNGLDVTKKWWIKEGHQDQQLSLISLM